MLTIPLIALALASTPTKDVALSRASQIVHDMSLPGVEVIPHTMDCGMINAFYIPETRDLILCNETVAAMPEAVPAFVAHEMAHAIIHQLDIPFTGSEEAAADELASVYLGMTGHADELMALALDYKRLAKQEPYRPEDDHPELNNRAWNAACMADGSDEHPVLDACAEKFKQAVRNWSRLVKTAEDARKHE